VDGTGSGSCSIAGFGISCVEPSGSATTVLVMFEICFIFRSTQSQITTEVRWLEYTFINNYISKCL
jgi:hypothetical protein